MITHFDVKSTTREYLEKRPNALYNIEKKDLQKIDRDIAKKLTENERVRQDCLQLAGATYI